jgi:hypothetical protein
VKRDLLSGEAFGDLLTGLQRTAFRLEALPQYLVDSETEAFTAFKRGELLLPSRSPDQASWESMIRRFTDAGRVFQRVHVLPEAMTAYLRFEIEWGYAYTQAAGERISFLPPSAPESIRRSATEDFWLFDDRILVYLIYNGEGRFLRLEKEGDDKCLADALQLRDALLQHAIPLKEVVLGLRGLK